jgi:carbonic anhydrase
MIATEEPLLRLRQGKARFVSGDVYSGAQHYRVRREQIVAGQEPFAFVVGCSDSRVQFEVIRTGSSVIRRLVECDGLLVEGTEYSLATGAVAFHDGESQ